MKISASYPGASALTVSQAVATPIEQEINGTPGMLYMESNSSNSGGFSATVTFDVSADPDLAAVEIQNRIKLAESLFACGSHSEWYFGRKAGSQPADDNLFDFQ